MWYLCERVVMTDDRVGFHVGDGEDGRPCVVVLAIMSSSVMSSRKMGVGALEFDRIG